jgi:hypothetical protein
MRAIAKYGTMSPSVDIKKYQNFLPLSQEQVNLLGTGALVVVFWAGGNFGRYMIRQTDQGPAAYTIPKHQGPAFVGRLNRVGYNTNLDRVWLNLDTVPTT